MPSKLEGQIWLSAEQPGKSFALDQVRLLQAIDRYGSISAAARDLGISYKTAWERLERMNNLSELPLVKRSAGGSLGGGSQLTPHGEKILQGFSRLADQHSDFIEKLGSGLTRIDDLASFVYSNRILSSAGNQFLGTVTALEKGAVNSEVTLKVNDRVSLVAIITEQSRAELAIETGGQLIAVVKASSILLTTISDLTVSARNIIGGVVSRLTIGTVNTEVTLDIGEGKTLNAVITNTSAERMGLQEGAEITALFKASSVILFAN